MIKIGNVVLKEKQKDLSRKGGKLNTRFFESTYTVVDIMKNGNCVLMPNKTNDILSTPCPMKHIKKYLQDLDKELDPVKNMVSSSISRLTNSMVNTPMTTGTVENASTGGSNTVISPVSSTPIILMQSTPIT